MFRLLLAMLIVVLATVRANESVATANEPTITVAPPEPQELTSDPGYGVKYTKERIIQLPQDQDKFFITIFGSPNDSKFQAVRAWFNDVPELAYLKSQTHFNTVTSDSPDFRAKYSKGISDLPVVRVQTATGGVVYQASGDNLPLSGQALSRAINSECLLRWRQKHKQPDQEKPLLDEDEGDEEDDEKVPDTGPGPVVDEVNPMAIIALAGLAGAVFCGGWTFVSHVKSRRQSR